MILVVGENPSKGYGKPFAGPGSGSRFAKLLGITFEELHSDVFVLVNLCDGPWDTVSANWRAREIFGRVKRGEGPRVMMLLGRRVNRAFGLGLKWFEWTTVSKTRVVSMPHPSGRCREWNDPENVRRARRVGRQVLEVRG